jgi:hypothetical protein
MRNLIEILGGPARQAIAFERQTERIWCDVVA